MKIRLMTKEDLPSVFILEQISYKDKWTLKNFEDELCKDYALMLVMDYNDKIIGYACTWILGEEAEINKFTIAEPLRGKGLGSILMQDILSRMVSAGVERVNLEVRVSNEKAYRLYEKHGFQEVFIRPKYYFDGEDAIIMTLNFMEGDEQYEETYIRD